MPVTRIRREADLQNWIAILKSTENSSKLTTFYPGLQLIPGPETMGCFRWIDFSFWATFLYVLGSIFYVASCIASPIYMGDDSNSADSPKLSLTASILFLLNAIVSFIDWYFQFRIMSMMNVSITNKGNSEIDDPALFMLRPSKMLSMLYLLNNICFLVSSILYVIIDLWSNHPELDTYSSNCLEEDYYCHTFWFEFWGALGYILASGTDSHSDTVRSIGQTILYLTLAYILKDFRWQKIC